jgi:hypothetical protein
MGTVYVPSSGAYRRSDDLVGTQLVHQQTYGRDVRDCILVPYFMEMYLLDRFRMDVALRLSDDIVYSKNISLDLLGDIHAGHYSPDVTHSRVVVMMGVTMVVVMFMVMLMAMVMAVPMIVSMLMAVIMPLFLRTIYLHRNLCAGYP